jgi:hypothetical protein
MNNLRSRAWLRALEELRTAGNEADRTETEIPDLLEQAVRIYAAATKDLAPDDLQHIRSEYATVKTQLMKKWASLMRDLG